MRLPGLSFSWRRAVGLTALRQGVARALRVPTTRAGLDRKVGRALLQLLLGRGKR